MSNDLYKIIDGKIKKTEFLDVKVKELMHGNYAIRFNCNGFGEMYFSGLGEEMLRKLEDKCKLVRTMTVLIDTCVYFLNEHDRLNWQKGIINMTWGELLAKIDLLQRSTPEVKIVEQSEFDKIVEG